MLIIYLLLVRYCRNKDISDLLSGNVRPVNIAAMFKELSESVYGSGEGIVRVKKRLKKSNRLKEKEKAERERRISMILFNQAKNKPNFNQHDKDTKKQQAPSKEAFNADKQKGETKECFTFRTEGQIATEEAMLPAKETDDLAPIDPKRESLKNFFNEKRQSQQAKKEHSVSARNRGHPGRGGQETTVQTID